MRNARFSLLLAPLAVALGLVVLVVGAARSPRYPIPPMPQESELADALGTGGKIDQFFAERWNSLNIHSALPADELTILRRLSLSLHGTVPSLEEIRRFEADGEPQRLERWAIQLMNDRRFADYFAARLARGFIGADGGQFIIFRRDRYTEWLADGLHENRPFDDLVREMIDSKGLWTGVPSTNYVTQAFADGVLDQNKLAGRTVRAFLGQRIDCAQCHNHPFADWKQGEFQGLAACFGQVKVSGIGVEDDAEKKYEVEDRMTLKTNVVEPAVPFGKEWWPEEGTVRHKLAAWVTHPDNRRFERAIANRVWGMVFGKPWMMPVDDLPNPPASPDAPRDLLDLLGADFREHHYDLKRLVFVITACRPFRLSSQHPAYETGENSDVVDANWAAFPLVRLRPEQMIGAMLQSSSIKTIDQNSHLLTRTIKFFRQQDFVRDYGDLGEAELEDRSGTIPQALLRMNGEFARDVAKTNPANASGRIAGMAPTDAAAIETVYLCCLGRRPAPAEFAFFIKAGEENGKVQRALMVEDVYWALLNGPEFCWNH